MTPPRGNPPQLADREVFHAMPAESGTVVVAFGALGGGHGHFHFFRLLKPLPGFSKLLVRDPHSRWYNDGLPGVGDSLAEIAVAIEREVERLGATRIVTFGSSMGAYAAILFGCMLGADHAIALGPQTLLDARLRHSPPADLSLQAPDLAPVIAAAPETRIDLAAGWEDHVDIFHARRVAELPSVRVLALRGRTHAFVLELFSEGQLVPLIAELVAGGTPDVFEVDPPMEPDTERRFAETAYATQLQDWEAVVESIGPVAERHPDWAGPSVDLGQALEKLEDLPGAEAAFAKAVRANPGWVKPRAALIRVLLRQKRVVEAELTTREGLALQAEAILG